MNRRLITAAVALLLAGGTFAVVDSAVAGKKKGEDHAQVEKHKMGAPEELRSLHFLAGEWDISETIIHDGEEVEQLGTATYKLVLDGAAIQGVYHGKYEEHDVEELTLTTFNRKSGNFEMVAANNLWPMLHVFSEGSFDDGKLVLSAHKMKEDKKVEMRRTVERTGDNSFTAVNEFNKGEGWTVWATESYTRRR